MARVEKSQYEQVDGQTIRPDIRLQTGLNRYPTIWISGLCDALGLPQRGPKAAKVGAAWDLLTDRVRLDRVLASLAEPSREARRLVLAAGGWMKYGLLARRVGNETGDSYFWGTRPPTSPIGQLRVRGLLLVGRMNLDGRNGKTTVIPKELRPLLAAHFGS